MGYEIIFHYKDEIERGVYSDEENTKTIKIGSPNEEVPLEAAAGKIFAQLARRNILVTDVEIYEFTKKKLSYKETPDGITIKNKKFKYDDGISVGVAVAEESSESAESGNGKPTSEVEKLLDLLAANPDLAAVLRGGGRLPSQTGASSPLATPPQSPPPRSLPHEGRKERPIRHEIFDPPPWLLKEARKRGLRFTVGKQYPIFKEKMADNPNAGMVYTTINDAGERQSLAGIHFNPVPVKLEGNFIEGPIQPSVPTSSGPSLSWDGVVDDAPLMIRR